MKSRVHCYGGAVRSDSLAQEFCLDPAPHLWKWSHRMLKVWLQRGAPP